MAAVPAPATSTVTAETMEADLFFDDETSATHDPLQVSQQQAEQPPQPDAGEVATLRELLQAQQHQISLLTATLSTQRSQPPEAILLGQQLQDTQQFIQFQKLQMEKQQQELEQMKALLKPVAPTAIDPSSSFSAEPPSLPYQLPVTSLRRSTAVAPEPPAGTTSIPPGSSLHTHARLGLTADFPTQTKKQQNHMTELRLGSRYVVRGSNGLS